MANGVSNTEVFCNLKCIVPAGIVYKNDLIYNTAVNFPIGLFQGLCSIVRGENNYDFLTIDHFITTWGKCSCEDKRKPHYPLTIVFKNSCTFSDLPIGSNNNI